MIWSFPEASVKCNFPAPGSFARECVLHTYLLLTHDVETVFGRMKFGGFSPYFGFIILLWQGLYVL